MENKATDKQINYLKSILNDTCTILSNYTDKNINQLRHKDIVDIFKKLNTPITPFIQNTKYIIKKKLTQKCFIGQQITPTNTMDLLVFKNMCVIDWDINKDYPTKELLLNHLLQFLQTKNYTFLLYETFKGYHGYIVSHIIDYYNYNTIKLLQELECDPFYIGFTRKVGFVVRLNKKTNRNETFIEKFCYQINKLPILPELQNLIDIKDIILH